MIGRQSRVLVIVAAVVQLISVGALFSTSPNWFAQWIGPLTIVAHLIAGVATIIWMYRAAVNVSKLNRGTRWGPIWAIIGWILPPVIFVIPSLQLGELWRASAADSDWKSTPSTPLAWIWGVLYSLCGLTAVVTSIVTSSAAANQLDQLAPGETVLVQWAPGIIVGALTAVGAAVAFVRLNSGISTRQEQLATSLYDAN